MSLKFNPSSQINFEFLLNNPDDVLTPCSTRLQPHLEKTVYKFAADYRLSGNWITIFDINIMDLEFIINLINA
jgi:hypothetical protein